MTDFETDLTAAEITEACSYSTVYGGELWCDTHDSAGPCPFDTK